MSTIITQTITRHILEYKPKEYISIPYYMCINTRLYYRIGIGTERNVRVVSFDTHECNMSIDEYATVSPLIMEDIVKCQNEERYYKRISENDFLEALQQFQAKRK